MNTEFKTEIREVYELETLSDSKLLDLRCKIELVIDACKDVNAWAALTFYQLQYRSIVIEINDRQL